MSWSHKKNPTTTTNEPNKQNTPRKNQKSLTTSQSTKNNRKFVFSTRIFLCYIIAILSFEMEEWKCLFVCLLVLEPNMLMDQNCKEQLSLVLFILGIWIIWSTFDFTSGSENFNFGVKWKKLEWLIKIIWINSYK